MRNSSRRVNYRVGFIAFCASSAAVKFTVLELPLKSKIELFFVLLEFFGCR